MERQPFIPAGSRADGGPGIIEQHEWQLAAATPRPDSEPSIGPLRVVAVVAIAALAVLILGAAAIAGWDRAESRVTGCDGYRGAEMVACVQERAQ